ncbi:uncharacterized protein MONBRDRAFT_30261 [Monosiga brevicollis MX1]|uniref:protein xylosyltransferase n=1 Tax=Monosiga brevicollis TaxID=81824 RepID=A9VDG4_MONBE|nr:uncharacterized protein MONBRDRAFT_30261 [Monosiga brevicollis MX1]EDQ84442.1 predicted protein [Monosiga brevicollis MX1]|eukprot:XP_001750737.1 hypothetical protein [Monosiga brevicollis MX1]
MRRWMCALVVFAGQLVLFGALSFALLSWEIQERQEHFAADLAALSPQNVPRAAGTSPQPLQPPEILLWYRRHVLTMSISVTLRQRAPTERCKKLIHQTTCLQTGCSILNNSVADAQSDASFSQPLLTRHGGKDAALMPPLRILFMLVVHGRDYRQLQHVLRAIYHPNHYYLIHVEARANHLYHQLKADLARSRLVNVFLTQFRLPTIWGASNLYEVYLRGMAQLAHLSWDYFINLSGADLPLWPIDDIVQFLSPASALGISFLKSHGKNHDRFIAKQGLDRTFVLCDNHMYRLEKRKLPSDLAMEGGSDWFMLHREFSDFVLADPPVVQAARRFYDFSLLSAESFFHVVAASADGFCHRTLSNNYRVANWHRERGCQCQVQLRLCDTVNLATYKAIVDWCGCSPMVYRREDLAMLQRRRHRPVMFGRKFDSTISHTIVEEVVTRLLLLPPQTDRASGCGNLVFNPGRHFLNVWDTNDGAQNRNTQTAMQALAASIEVSC